ncbi:PLP-dependent aminotransferase family protein [Litoribacillus peritrichatus]|uniref:PLP-dependent aminotransferase family protein n=1 Tax=Litoribacillus peritrichatus TaxID=718191 RepID=A0ABP7MJK6_9GAMM
MASNRTGVSQRFQFDALVITPDSEKPLFRQLEEQLRDAIWCGRLKPNERLPSTRQLSSELGVGRNTVINAYEQLTVEGFIVTEKGSGTLVSKDFPANTLTGSQTRKQSLIEQGTPIKIELAERYHAAEAIQFAVPMEDGSDARPFRAHTPACREFPTSLWTQLTHRRLKNTSWSWLDKSNACGFEALREAISGYLGASRGITAKSENIFISAGAQQGVALLAQLLINPGDVVVFEEPGYTPAAIAFEMAGAKVVSIPVDQEGLDVDVLADTVKRAKLVYVTPASHFPLGITMSQARRKALLSWASAAGALIIEDDYNGEYQYRGRPLATLFSMAEKGRVIYFGSFSKLLFPALRLGYMVVDDELIQPLASVRWLVDRHSPPLEQAVLADFINEGHFARHLRRMRTLYIERQAVLTEQAHKHLSHVMSVPSLDAGLHLVGWLHPEVKEERVAAAFSHSGLELMTTSKFYRYEVTQPGLILGYASFSPVEIQQAILALKNAYDAL